jgi:mRNA-degrading endonuclease RelE of RelBE toxin-antitoxin system
MTTLPLSDAKSRLSEIADEVRRTHDRVHITKNGREYEGYWRARRGEYRVRYTIDDESRVVTVADISHRREAYC